MRGRRLLERLRTMEKDPDWRGTSDPQIVIASVLAHLAKILNTRQGSAPTAIDLGMPDFTILSGALDADSLPAMEETLTQVISRYEPRLADVRVHSDPLPDRPFMVTFKLTAKVQVEDRKLPVVFETMLDADGHITVSE